MVVATLLEKALSNRSVSLGKGGSPTAEQSAHLYRLTNGKMLDRKWARCRGDTPSRLKFVRVVQRTAPVQNVYADGVSDNAPGGGLTPVAMAKPCATPEHFTLISQMKCHVLYHFRFQFNLGKCSPLGVMHHNGLTTSPLSE